MHTEGQFIRRCQDLVMQELVNAGEDVLIFYNDKVDVFGLMKNIIFCVKIIFSDFILG